MEKDNSKIEKLTKIILHASKNGFDFCKWKLENTDLPLMGVLEGNVKQLFKSSYCKLLLLDKKFAKCFWDYKTYYDGCLEEKPYKDSDWDKNERWKRHFWELVLEDNLIDYYFKFLEKK